MGIGMCMFTQSRLARGWSSWRIVKHFLVRGFLLLVFGRIVNMSIILPYLPVRAGCDLCLCVCT